MPRLAEAVVAAARPERRNVVVCGAASVGKSTLINVLSRHVLRLSHEGNVLSHHVAAQARTARTHGSRHGAGRCGHVVCVITKARPSYCLAL